MADQPFPREQSIPVSFLKGGLLAGMEGALNPEARREAQQVLDMYRQMDLDHQERVLMQTRGGRVLKQAIMQILLFEHCSASRTGVCVCISALIVTNFLRNGY